MPLFVLVLHILPTESQDLFPGRGDNVGAAHWNPQLRLKWCGATWIHRINFLLNIYSTADLGNVKPRLSWRHLSFPLKFLNVHFYLLYSAFNQVILPLEPHPGRVLLQHTWFNISHSFESGVSEEKRLYGISSPVYLFTYFSIAFYIQQTLLNVLISFILIHKDIF